MPRRKKPGDPNAPKGAPRREKFDAKRKDEYLSQLRDGEGRMIAARNIDIHYNTVKNHIVRYPGFLSDIIEAERESVQSVANALYQAAVSGNVTAAIFLLTNRAPDQWADRRLIQAQIQAQLLTAKQGDTDDTPLLPAADYTGIVDEEIDAAIREADAIIKTGG